MLKADQVEHLKAELAGSGGDQIDLEHGESGAPIGLVGSQTGTGLAVDSGSGTMGSGSMGGSGMGSGTGAAMSGTGLSGLTGSGVIGLADSAGGSGIAPAKDDTSLAADLGLTGSLGGIPSPGKTGTGIGIGGATGTFAGKSGTASGITIFGGEDAERADPSAQTAVSAGTMQDQVNLEGVGSGSGLLDLTREADDTSLGGELGGSGRAADTRASGLSAVGEGGGRVISQPTYVEQADPLAPAFGAAALGTAMVLLFAAFVLTSAVFGYTPGFLTTIAEKGFLMLVLGGLVVTIIFFLVGLGLGRAGGRR